MKKIIAVLLIFLGCAIMLYPTGTQLYSSYMQKKLIHEWETQTKSDSQTKEESYKNLDKVFASSENEAESDSSSTLKDSNQQSNGILGTLEIKKINLKLPILEGASLKNLKIAAGHLEGTALPGKTGNSAIAAHRSRTYGKMFNRLPELNAGDEIIVQDKQHQYIYKVYQKSVVEPTDLSVLNGHGNDKILTLITCDRTGTHRVIVHAKLVRMN